MAGWRTLDILSANLLLARTMGHALGVDHPLIARGWCRLFPRYWLLDGVLLLMSTPYERFRLVLTHAED